MAWLKKKARESNLDRVQFYITCPRLEWRWQVDWDPSSFPVRELSFTKGNPMTHLLETSLLASSLRPLMLGLTIPASTEQVFPGDVVFFWVWVACKGSMSLRHNFLKEDSSDTSFLLVRHKEPRLEHSKSSSSLSLFLWIDLLKLVLWISRMTPNILPVSYNSSYRGSS